MTANPWDQLLLYKAGTLLYQGRRGCPRIRVASGGDGNPLAGSVDGQPILPMKPLAITCLVCGTVLVLAPIVQNVIALQLLSQLIAGNHGGQFQLHGPLADSYAGWCLFLGLCLFSAGIAFAYRFGREERSERSAASGVPVGGVA